ncbi:NADPH-dependent FMN reductase [Ensifer adhaerens]|uniref:NADPH-dependent FMN reductase n=1 Tax=Ensifer adhaerens TaxID=106592 RepID=UPI000FDB3B30|nr:NAD(P)H-dependent oxidoreductase [Ensifer adhaerens]MDF8357662.1 NAD(P)H-dependent oxidoreductase [Ensifer adhaerens]THA60193.1 NADPH-dependent oxidoreductase [Ensifer adhaerens]
MKKIAVLVGSLRRDSLNLRFARALERLSEGIFAFHYVDLASLPLYNDDLWSDVPASVVELKRRIDAADGVLLVSPEYNRSFPAVLKNALEWASRPYADNSWRGKPASLVGASPGVIGTAAGQSQLRSVMVSLGTILMGSPEVYLNLRPELIDEAHHVADPGTRAFLEAYLQSFDAWIDQVSP